MSAGRAGRPSCEYDRAYKELVSTLEPLAQRSPTPCSPEVPEVRDYPPPPAGRPSYVLCNGHLSDLFTARERGALIARATAVV